MMEKHMSITKFENCPACNAKPSSLHRLGCDVERCPRCGLQLLSCEHFLFGAAEPPPDEERLPWTGEWPGEAECRELGWWCKISPAGLGNIPCALDDPDGGPDLNRLCTEGIWDRRRKRFIRKEDLGAARLALHRWYGEQPDDVKTIDDLVFSLQDLLDELRLMRELGVVLSDSSDLPSGHAILITTDPAVARRFGFEVEGDT
jgi:hypothetical protein